MKIRMVSTAALGGFLTAGLFTAVSGIAGFTKTVSAGRLESVVICALNRHTWSRINKNSEARLAKGSIITCENLGYPAISWNVSKELQSLGFNTDLLKKIYITQVNLCLPELKRITVLFSHRIRHIKNTGLGFKCKSYTNAQVNIID